MGTLPGGATLRGVYGWADRTAAAGYSPVVPLSYQFPLPSSPTINVIAVGGASTPACPGTSANPQAAPGNLCVYQSRNDGDLTFEVLNEVEGGRFGAVLYFPISASTDYEYPGDLGSYRPVTRLQLQRGGLLAATLACALAGCGTTSTGPADAPASDPQASQRAPVSVLQTRPSRGGRAIPSQARTQSQMLRGIRTLAGAQAHRRQRTAQTPTARRRSPLRPSRFRGRPAFPTAPRADRAGP